ncbi:ATP-binding protein [Streptosporangium saharense]|uniref:Uncharacterized protein n=1 Tax=Streptosporangium saharense TaxID=1706840 RepID=A0A7W7QSR2_9ACTN|nr:ATP-binding protein [Streptosporangium saharense]MBB4919115.1 hypothetical protein [Streptosporangium saharense]
MGGVETVRGIAYQQAQAVLTALDVLDDLDLSGLRVEGADDVVDIEVFTTAGTVCHAKQVKVRAEQYTWGEAELLAVLRRWAKLPEAVHASFEFLTDGRLGPTGAKVQAALESAVQGERQVLAAMLGEDANSALCSALVNARVRIDPVGVGTLLLRAERQVMSMLPQARTAADAREQAERAVGALFRLLFDRAGDPDAEARVITREQVAATLGVPADQPASQRWPGGVRDRYLQVARNLPLDSISPPFIERQGPVRPSIRPLNDQERENSVDASMLLLSKGPMILAGRTGTGKSTTARTLCQEAAKSGKVVLLAHAETYIPGRLEALAADAVSDLLDEDLPFATGRQVLADRSVTLIIDGVSEVPASIRNALRDELRASVSAGRGARIMVLGRDVAALREVLPQSVSPATYVMSDFDTNRRFDLACRTLLGQPLIDNEKSPEAHQVRTIVAQVEYALGDAAGNPLLFTMGLALVAEGIPFTSRATLYDGFIERLAARSGTTGIIMAAAALGIIYSRLLDQERRYADPYEWARLVAAAAIELVVPDPSSAAAAIDDAARRSGLVNPIGFTQMLAPLHDSFADYLAGLAYARNLSSLPTRLQHGDEQRVLFAAEIGGVDADLAALVARDQPFLSVRLADFDHRSLSNDTPSEVETLLRYLVPADEVCTVALWRMIDGRVVAMRYDRKQSSWTDELSAKIALRTVPSVVIQDGGPLVVAVRLWRQCLLAKLQTSPSLRAGYIATIKDACFALAAHAEQTAAATARLIEVIAPPGHAYVLGARVGPVGLSAKVYPAAEGIGGMFWPVSYRQSDSVQVAAAQSEKNASGTLFGLQEGGRSNVEEMVKRGPESAAAERIREAIKDLTKPGWLSV